LKPHFPDLKEPTILCLLNEFSEQGGLEVIETAGEQKRHWARSV
jgi:hypothetical protein